MPAVPDIRDKDLAGLTKLIRNPVTGLVYKRRFQMVLDLCQGLRLGTVLEIGYGAGFLAYSLAPSCGRYFGVDVHTFSREVEAVLSRQGIANVSLSVGDARRLDGLDAGSLDLVVSLSCLEHIRELDRVQQQVVRVLKPGGFAVYGLPVKNFLTRLLFRAAGYDDRIIHPSTPKDCHASAVAAGLAPDRQRCFPRGAGHALGLYWAGRYRKPLGPGLPPDRGGQAGTSSAGERA